MTNPKKICPNCFGNGFVRVKESINRIDDVIQCVVCNSQGEVRDKEYDEYFERYKILKPSDA